MACLPAAVGTLPAGVSARLRRDLRMLPAQHPDRAFVATGEGGAYRGRRRGV